MANASFEENRLQLVEKFKEEIGKVSWSWLRPHESPWLLLRIIRVRSKHGLIVEVWFSRALNRWRNGKKAGVFSPVSWLNRLFFSSWLRCDRIACCSSLQLNKFQKIITESLLFLNL